MASQHKQTHQTQPKATWIIAGASIIALLICWVLFSPDQDQTAKLPNFSAISDVKTKKQQFFNYFQPLVEQQNENIEALRTQLINNENLDQDFLNVLASAYRLEISNPATEQDVKQLLQRIDILPSSLVLSQAAIESAWGTSRFAKEGFNFFGQWCFTKGCGLVPASRDNGAHHEVKRFSSPKESVQAYFHNINSHPSYANLRDIRYAARMADQPIHGCELAKGLEFYSERGMHYINEVRLMIRANNLSPYDETACQDLPIPEPEQEDQTIEERVPG